MFTISTYIHIMVVKCGSIVDVSQSRNRSRLEKSRSASALWKFPYVTSTLGACQIQFVCLNKLRSEEFLKILSIPFDITNPAAVFFGSSFFQKCPVFFFQNLPSKFQFKSPYISFNSSFHIVCCCDSSVCETSTIHLSGPRLNTDLGSTPWKGGGTDF